MSNPVILLVEDNSKDEELTLRALRKNNIRNEVVIKRDGAEALEYLFSASELPQVVLLDLKLPKIDGIEVLKQIRTHEATKLLPVVVLTTSNEQRDLLASYGAGCNGYVRKPVDFVQFAEAVKQLGLFWLVVNQSPPRTGR